MLQRFACTVCGLIAGWSCREPRSIQIHVCRYGTCLCAIAWHKARATPSAGSGTSPCAILWNSWSPEVNPWEQAKQEPLPYVESSYSCIVKDVTCWVVLSFVFLKNLETWSLPILAFPMSMKCMYYSYPRFITTFPILAFQFLAGRCSWESVPAAACIVLEHMVCLKIEPFHW